VPLPPPSAAVSAGAHCAAANATPLPLAGGRLPPPAGHACERL
jgi:hypothetical protein